MLGFDTNPKVYNPRQGYIANWNNPPIKGYPNPDMIWLSWGAADRQNELEQRLRAKGIEVFVGHKAENLGEAEVVVVSTAIKKNNPELVAAREKLPVENQGSGASRDSGMDIAVGVACCPLPRYT